MLVLNINKMIRGRAVGFGDDGKLFLGRKYDLYSYGTGQSPELVAQVPCSWERKLIAPSHLLCRLFRHELRGAGILSDGTKVVATRKGLFYGDKNEMMLQRT